MKVFDMIQTILLFVLGVIHIFSPDLGRMDLSVLYFACAGLFAHMADKSENKDKED